MTIKQLNEILETAIDCGCENYEVQLSYGGECNGIIDFELSTDTLKLSDKKL